jgi:hypothetical protein
MALPTRELEVVMHDYKILFSCPSCRPWLKEYHTLYHFLNQNNVFYIIGI